MTSSLHIIFFCVSKGLAYAYILREKIVKLDMTSGESDFIGYDEHSRNAYQLFHVIKCKVYMSRDMMFDKKTAKL